MRRIIAVVIVFATIFSVPTAFSETPKINGACTKINQFFESKPTLLVCVTVKGKKIWHKANSAQKSLFLKDKNRLTKVAAEAVAKVVPTPSSPPAPIANQDLNIQNINLAKSNGTYYQETASCHSNRIVSTLQVRNQQQWQDVAPGRGWIRIAENCFQPWTTYSATENQSLRWRLADPGGAWELFSQEFKGNKLSTQARVTPSPSAAATVRPSVTPTPSAAATVRPSVTPSPSAAATVRPSVMPSPSAAATVRPSVTPTPSALPSASPTPTALPSASPTPTALPSASPTPTALPSASPTPSATFVVPIDQQPLVINSKLLMGGAISFTAGHPEVFVLSTSGGSGTGGVSYSLNSGSYCNLEREAGKLYASRPTTCTVTARKLASPGFKEVFSASTQFVFTSFPQDPPVVSYTVSGGSKAESMAIGETAILQGDYLSSVAPLSFAVSGENCLRYAPWTLTATTKTVCTVVATRPAYTTQRMTSVGTGVRRDVTLYFDQISSAPVSFVFDFRDQAPLIIWAQVTTAKAGTPIAIFSSGGSGIGTKSYSVSGEGCSISSPYREPLLTAAVATTCVVTATKAANPSGYRSAVNSPPQNFYFTAP